MKNQIQNAINSYLTFRIGDEFYATIVSKVISILEMIKITRVPDAPMFMQGVINFNENVIPVIDSRIKFGLLPAEPTPNTCIIVLEIDVEGEPVLVGSIVDGVQEVIEIEQSMIKKPPSLGKKYKSEFISGILSQGQDFIMILDMDKIFSNEDIVLLRETAETLLETEEMKDENDYLDPSEYEGFYIDSKEKDKQ